MSERPDPAERPDDDNPELTRAELQKARPAREVLPELIGEKAATEILKGTVGNWARREQKHGRVPVQK